MARLTFKGADELADKLLTLGDKGHDMAKMALYDGAGVVADALKGACASLPVGTPIGNSETGHPFHGLTEEDREDLANGIGIAKFADERDAVTTAISFNGYARRTEDDYPQGVPLALLARSMESGSSVRRKHAFVRPAINAVKAAALSTMQQKIEDEIKKTMEG